MKNAAIWFLALSIGLFACKKESDPQPQPGEEDQVETLGIYTLNEYTYVIDADGDLWVRGGAFSASEEVNDRGYFLFDNQVRKFSYGNLSRRMYILKEDNSLWRTAERPTDETNTSIHVKATEKIADQVQDVQAGRGFAAFLKIDGTVWALGENGSGEFGIGTSTYEELPLMQIADGIKKLAVGYSNIYLLKEDNTLWASGNYIYGKLGFPTDRDQKTFVKIMDEVSEVKSNGNGVMVLKTDGSAWSFGSNTNGMQGTGEASQEPTYPHQVGTSVKQIIAMDYACFYIKTDNSLWACGNNSFGLMGMESPRNLYHYTQIAENVSAVSEMSSNDHMVILQNGQYKMSGFNNNRQLQQSDIDSFTIFTDFETP